MSDESGEFLDQAAIIGCIIGCFESVRANTLNFGEEMTAEQHARLRVLYQQSLEFQEWVVFDGVQALTSDKQTLQAELTRLRGMCDVYQNELRHAETRNERLALLVRLIVNNQVWLEMFSDTRLVIRAREQGNRQKFSIEAEVDTNDIPDLTPEQWERLFKLERGEA